MRALPALTMTLLVALMVFGATVLAQPRPSLPPYVVIVHPSNPATSVERKFLEDAFLKKVTRWQNGEVIRPVDLGPDSATRRKFTEDILNRTISAVKGYWQQRIFSGRDVPPPEVDNDDQVVRYVL